MIILGQELSMIKSNKRSQGLGRVNPMNFLSRMDFGLPSYREGCAPLYLRELLVKQANTRTLRSNTKNVLQIPITNLKRFGDRAFYAYAPRLWNELPDNIKAADSVQNFQETA